MNKKDKTIFDVAVIGGGPAGMMAAITASQNGANVILLEKNKRLGVKLMTTGGGRCNITNAQNDIKKFAAAFGEGKGFLLSVFSQFNSQDTISFFEEHGLKLKVERGERVFPKSDKASSVIKTLTQLLKKNKVVTVTDIDVHRLSVKDKNIRRIILKNKNTVYAKNIIIATGGVSYPTTGSTGDGLRWAKGLEHNIANPTPSLTPLRVEEAWVKELQGLSLKNVELTANLPSKKIKKFGECLFTHYGLSGPVPLDMSRGFGEVLLSEKIILSIDLKPALSYEKLDKRVLKDLSKYSNKKIKNSLDALLPSKIIPVIIKLSAINPEKKSCEITKEERARLVKLLKNMNLTVVGLEGFNNAIVTKGGVCLSEIDQKTMRSKKISNLFFAGEVINVDGPTGGFNLQVCWSTGYIAGKAATKNISKENE